MTWLIFIVAIIVYTVIGQFVAGMMEADEPKENVSCTIIWPIVVVTLIFSYPFAWIRKLGRKLGEWIEKHDPLF